MSDLNPSNVVSVAVKQFPQYLIIPGEKNQVSLQITNHSTKEENYLLECEGENLDVSVISPGFEEQVKFKSNETKSVELSLQPKVDGYGKLIINLYWIEIVQYTEKVQKIREKIVNDNLNKILKNKTFLSIENLPSFNPKNYILEISKDNLKQLEKNLKSLKEQLDTNSLSKNNSRKKIIEIDNQLKELAKAYLFNNDFYKALESSFEISEEKERIDFYYNLLRAYADRNLEACLQVIKNLNDPARKNQVLSDISVDLFDKDPEKVLSVLSIIDNLSYKEKALLKIVSKAANQNNTQLALRFTNAIDNNITKIKVLFSIIRILDKNNNKGLILPILNQINDLLLNSEIIANENQNSIYEFIKDSIGLTAKLDGPKTADSLIQNINDDILRNKVSKDLFDEIYEMVDEIKIKLEKKTVLSHSYSVNTYVSRITREIRNFSLIGGNVSTNTLMKNYDFNFVLVSLFSFNFSIFPIIERLYFDFTYNTKKSFAYYIFPSISNHDADEQNVIKQTVTQFFSPFQISKQMIIFNLDFIPYLGKPTVILASEGSTVQNVKNKLETRMKGVADILIDDDLFKGGDAQITLSNIFHPNNFTVINLILSYEFLNNYDAFKLFIEALI